MNKHMWILMTVSSMLASVIALLLLATPVAGEPTPRVPAFNDLTLASITTSPPVVFLHDPQWPSYAQTEITVDPEPPMAGRPTELCVWVMNTSDVSQTVTLDFGVANFGIGLPFAPVGSRTVTVSPHGQAKACLAWVPPQSSRWCIQAILHVLGFADQMSQRNIDLSEVLQPGVAAPLTFPVHNPLTSQASIHLEPKVNPNMANWGASLSQVDLSLMPGQTTPITLVVTPPIGTMLGTGDYIVDVEATALVGQERQLIGGFRKMDWPPVPLHRMQDPPYAESEITVEPYPPQAGEPTHICVELTNQSNTSRAMMANFQVSTQLGIGLPWNSIDQQITDLPPQATTQVCTMWIPPIAGQFSVQITLHDPQNAYVDQSSQRNLDVNEVLIPGQPQPSSFVFPVRNPNPFQTTINLTTTRVSSFFDVWLDTYLLSNVPSGGSIPVTLYVKPKAGFVPEDGMLIADIEASFIDAQQKEQLIGGFRKIYRPPVPIHRTDEPIYAESEISINPYPPRSREPTEICADIRNATDDSQTVTATFATANFGIGLPFATIATPQIVSVPAHSSVRKCVVWVPPTGGQFCARVTLATSGYDAVESQRNMDVSEILLPGQPSSLTFPVGNPTTQTMTVTLGTVLHQEGWQVALSKDTLTNMAPSEIRLVTLVVTPATNAAMPLDGAPVADVEGYIGGELIGGFRKIYGPPVPVYNPGDPVYAESEIYTDPYPAQVGMPTVLGAVVHNPTNVQQTTTVTFRVANWGIGMPFDTTGILTPTTVVNIPPMGAARVATTWIAQYSGLFCVQIQLQSAGFAPVYSQHNIDVGEPLNPQVPHSSIIRVRNPTTQTATINLGLINHRPEWIVTLAPTVLSNVLPGAIQPVTLTVQPSSWANLADGDPIADVEAYLNGGLIGGVRKIAKPPVPLHKPQDRPYGESEIGVTPYPVVASQPATITAQITNTSEQTQTTRVLFGVANLGVGIPFTTTGIVTPSVVVTLGPGMSTTVSSRWTPPSSGPWCIQIKLQDPNNQYPEQVSQRNIEVERGVWQQCEPITRQFQLQNPLPTAITVMLGTNAINLPAGWTYSTDITETVLAPGQSKMVAVTITPPCGHAVLGRLPRTLLDTGGASGPIEINIEAYADGKILTQGAGIQIQLESVKLTTTSVTSSANPSVYGQSVTFTATVTGAGTPTGSVQFKDNGAALGAPVNLAGSSANLTTSALTVGTHTITAEYSGDSSFAPSTGTLSGGQVVNEAPVSNDDFDSATPISSMPYSTTEDTTKATTASDDPTFTCFAGKGSASVWFSFKPSTNGVLKANTTGSNYDTVLAVWQGTRGSLSNVACNDNNGTAKTSSLSANLIGGTTYYIEVAGHTAGGALKLAISFTPKAPAAVTLLSPAKGTQSTSASQVLDWTDSPGATYYQVQVRKGSSTGTLVDISQTHRLDLHDQGTCLQLSIIGEQAACNTVGCSWSGLVDFQDSVASTPDASISGQW